MMNEPTGCREEQILRANDRQVREFAVPGVWIFEHSSGPRTRNLQTPMTPLQPKVHDMCSELLMLWTASMIIRIPCIDSIAYEARYNPDSCKYQCRFRCEQRHHGQTAISQPCK